MRREPQYVQAVILEPTSLTVGTEPVQFVPKATSVQSLLLNLLFVALENIGRLLENFDFCIFFFPDNLQDIKCSLHAQDKNVTDTLKGRYF